MYYTRTSSLKLSVIISILLIPASIQAQIPDLSASAEARKIDTKRNLRPQNTEAKVNYNALVAAIRRELLVKPDNSVLYNNLGTSYAHLKLYEEALEAIKRAIEINPKNSEFFYNLSIVYFHLNRPAESLEAICRSVELNPRNVAANYQFCELNVILKKFNEAAGCYENLPETIQLDAISYAHYGFSLIYTNQIKKAVRVLERASQLFPKEAVVQNNLGMSLFKNKQHKKAITAFHRALEINPEFTPARFNLALAEIKNRNKTAAIKQYFIIKNRDANLAKKLYKLIYGDKVVFLEDFKKSKK